MIRYTITLALLLATTGLANAQTIDEQIASFTGADGFDLQSADHLEMELANLWLDDNAMSPGGLVGPIEKAMMIAEGAIPSVRTRTAIAYGQIIDDEDGAPVPYSFIEVRHYNLGAVIHAETAEAYGEENTAEIAEFGLGDHMAWRFVFRPVMGHSAMLLDASSRVITDDDASDDDCNGVPCLDSGSSPDEVAQWQVINGKLPTWPPLYPTEANEVTAPAYAISQLAVLGFWANAESGHYQWTGGEHPEAARGYEPYRFITVDRNLGQELAIDSVWRETALNDDSLAAISFRQIDIAGDVTLMRASGSR